MARLPRPIGPLSGRDQATLHQLRENRRERHTLISGMAQTAHLFASDNPLVTADLFPDRQPPVTFAMRVRRDTVAASGILFEFGGVLSGCAAWIDGAELGFAAGDAAGNTGVDLTIADAFPVDGQVFDVVFNAEPASPFNPSNSRIRVWIDGKLRGSAEAVSVFPASPDGWSDSGDGAIGDVDGTVTPRVPVAQRIALVNATIAGGLRVFFRQTPRRGNE